MTYDEYRASRGDFSASGSAQGVMPNQNAQIMPAMGQMILTPQVAGTATFSGSQLYGTR